MRVHVVAPFHSRAMEQLVVPLLRDTPPWLQITAEDTPDWSADLNYFIPWIGMINQEIKGPCAAYYTHTNPGQEELIQVLGKTCKGIAVMSQEDIKKFPTGKIRRAIPPGVDGFQPRKRNILVVGAEQPNGRKRSWILLDLAWKFDLSNFHFIIVGTGWEFVVEKLKNLGVAITYYESVVDPTLKTLYASADAFLVTAYTEGGPITVIEALASGTQVISPAYGLASSLSHFAEILHYEDITTLHARLEEIATPARKRHAVTIPYSVKTYRDWSFEFLQQCLNIPYPSRYDWLTATIIKTRWQVDRDLPFYLMEIGTGRGINAAKMLTTACAFSSNVHYYGYDLFRELTAEEMERELSKQPDPVAVVETRLKELTPNITLFPGDTKTTLAHPYSGGPMDLIFVDGGHSWETINSDWHNIQRYIGPSTTIIFDDYYTDVEGEVGCQRLIDSLDRSRWSVEILEPQETWGRLKINMVMVRLR